MIDLIFKLIIVGVFALGTAWFFVYYIIALKYKSDPHFKEARSKISFIKAQPRAALNLFAIYRYIEIAIYCLLVVASILIALQFGMHWLSK